MDKKLAEKIVFMYMKALEKEKLSLETWKKLARVNQLLLDKYKLNICIKK